MRAVFKNEIKLFFNRLTTRTVESIIKAHMMWPTETIRAQGGYIMKHAAVMLFLLKLHTTNDSIAVIYSGIINI